MNTNNPSDKNRVQHLEQDANENANDNQNVSDAKNADKKRMQQSSDNKDLAGRGEYRSNKGTGMSSEAGSEQSEKSWQGTTGSKPGASENRNYNNDAGGGNNYSNNQRQNAPGTTTASVNTGINKNNTAEEEKNKQQEWNKSNK